MKAWRSLRVRLTISYTVLAFALLAFVGYVFSNALSIYAISVQYSQTGQSVRQARSILDEAKGQNLSPQSTLTLLRKRLPGVLIELVKAPPSPKSVVPLGPFRRETFLPTRRMLFLSSLKPRDRIITLPMVVEKKGILSAYFYRFTFHPIAFEAFSALYEQILEVLGLALGLSGLIGWLLSRWLGRPLSRLAAATESVAAGSFLEMVGQSGIIELDRVVEQFNRMVLHLRESFSSLAAERDTAQRFAADAAHELKTPVATLRAYQDVISKHPERLEQALPAIGRQIERMEQVISGLLQLAALEKGGGIAVQATDLCAFISRLEPVYQALAAESRHTLTICCPEVPVQVLSNQRLLESCLDNLMENACKYTPNGGQVALTVNLEDNQAKIVVQDSGKGIPKEELPYIFDRFHRGVDTQSIPGTGLGLAIVREFLKRMNGTISVESTVGIGTKFVIQLAVQKRQPPFQQ